MALLVSEPQWGTATSLGWKFESEQQVNSFLRTSQNITVATARILEEHYNFCFTGPSETVFVIRGESLKKLYMLVEHWSYKWVDEKTKREFQKDSSVDICKSYEKLQKLFRAIETMSTVILGRNITQFKVDMKSSLEEQARRVCLYNEFSDIKSLCITVNTEKMGLFPKIVHLSNVQELTIIAPHLMTLSQSICSLVGMQKLVIRSDSLLEVSSKIGELILLEQLEIEAPKIQAIPALPNGLKSCIVNGRENIVQSAPSRGQRDEICHSPLFPQGIKMPSLVKRTRLPLRERPMNGVFSRSLA